MRGSLSLGRWRGVPVQLHWTAPLGALVLGRLAFVPGFWLGFLLTVLVHELGHAFLVKSLKFKVLEVQVHGLGGYCRWQGAATKRQRALIAWGGVMGQGVLLVATLAVLGVTGRPTTPFWGDLVDAFTTRNLWIAGLNLLPIPPLDGAEAWPGLRAAIDRRFRAFRRNRIADAEARKEQHLADMAAQAEGDELLPELKETVDRILREAQVPGKTGDSGRKAG